MPPGNHLRRVRWPLRAAWPRNGRRVSSETRSAPAGVVRPRARRHQGTRTRRCPRASTTYRGLKLRGDGFIRTLRRLCSVPCAAVWVGDRIRRLRQDIVGPATIVQWRRTINGRSHQRMTKPHLAIDLKEAGSFGRSRGSGGDAKSTDRGPEKRWITKWLSRGHHEQQLCFRRELDHPPDEAVLDLTCGRSQFRDGEPTGYLEPSRRPGHLEQCQWVAAGLRDNPISDSLIHLDMDL